MAQGGAVEIKLSKESQREIDRLSRTVERLIQINEHGNGLVLRIAQAIEGLAEPMPEIQIDPGPPMCPHCGTYDPEVEEVTGVGGWETKGQLSEWFLHVRCCQCGKVFYGNAESWSMHQDERTLMEEIAERNERAKNEYGSEDS